MGKLRTKRAPKPPKPKRAGEGPKKNGQTRRGGQVKDMSYLVITKSGLAIPCQNIRPAGNMISLETSGAGFTVQKSSIRTALEINPRDTFQHLAKHRDDPTLTRLLASVVELDALANEYRKAFTHSPEASYRPITVFGSGALTLSILPNRDSDDLDIAATLEFKQFWDSKRAETPEHGARPVQVCHYALLRYLGQWEARAAALKGEEMVYGLLHPVDVLSQKLLRTDGAKFEKKDKPDIATIIETLNIDKETLLAILTENPARYSMDPGHPCKLPLEKNTKWLLKTYLPEITLKEVKAKAIERELDMLKNTGLLWKTARFVPKETLRLGDMLEP